jgi:hypothetical protein
LDDRHQASIVRSIDQLDLNRQKLDAFSRCAPTSSVRDRFDPYTDCAASDCVGDASIVPATALARSRKG